MALVKNSHKRHNDQGGYRQYPRRIVVCMPLRPHGSPFVPARYKIQYNRQGKHQPYREPYQPLAKQPFLPVPVLPPPFHKHLFLLRYHNRILAKIRHAPERAQIHIPPYLFASQRFIRILFVKPITLKVDNLLAQYLYQYKKLSLTGIGIFTLDDAAVLSDETAKTKTPIEGIAFVSKNVAQPEDSLIEFIKAQTGKMKALAMADLDSYIMLAHQFLNIGKPFYLEGIGTLQKNRDGSFTFNPGTSIAVKAEDSDAKKKTGATEETKTEENSNRDYRGLVLGLGIVATLAVVAFGGYYLYNKNADNGAADTSNMRIVADSQVTKNISPDTANHQTMAAPPGATPAPPVTTTAVVTPPPVTPANGFTFVLETPHKRRALMRYENIKDSRITEDFDSKIQMETKDSVTFKIFVVLPCAPADTTRYKELLNAWYYGGDEIKVKIEH
jgi:hypothetical protein